MTTALALHAAGGPNLKLCQPLVSTRQIHDFLKRLDRQDRVPLAGDTRQDQTVEAARPFGLLRDADSEALRTRVLTAGARAGGRTIEAGTSR